MKIYVAFYDEGSTGVTLDVLSGPTLENGIYSILGFDPLTEQLHHVWVPHLRAFSVEVLPERGEKDATSKYCH